LSDDQSLNVANGRKAVIRSSHLNEPVESGSRSKVHQRATRNTPKTIT
jgi:hypothetical protein